MIGIECQTCENAVSPRGVQLISRIEQIIRTDPEWPKFCLRKNTTSEECADYVDFDEPEKSKASISSVTNGFKIVFPND